MEPLPWIGTVAETMQRLKKVLASLPRTRIVEERADYVRAEVTSRLLRFVDDVEFFLDSSSQLIHFRSASRMGYADFGVNRTRMEIIRRAYLEQPG
jgi:uncharacterized protein (DUF1499 family)